MTSPETINTPRRLPVFWDNDYRRLIGYAEVEGDVVTLTITHQPAVEAFSEETKGVSLGFTRKVK